eukprot:981676-Rhodomonas_salina.1
MRTLDETLREGVEIPVLREWVDVDEGSPQRLEPRVGLEPRQLVPSGGRRAEEGAESRSLARLLQTT